MSIDAPASANASQNRSFFSWSGLSGNEGNCACQIDLAMMETSRCAYNLVVALDKVRNTDLFCGGTQVIWNNLVGQFQNLRYEPLMIRVIQAIQRAKTAQVSFSSLSYQERALLLRKLADVIERDQMKVIGWDSHGAVAENQFLRENSVRASILRLQEAASQLESYHASEMSFMPTGLVTIVLPSVLAFRVLCERLAPALAAGNCVLVKVSGRTNSRIADWSAEFEAFLQEAGFEKGVCQLIQGSRDEVGSLMISHPAIQAVSFAGRFLSAESIFKLPGLFQKKLQFSKSGNNSAILVGENWDQDQLQLLVESCFQGGGLLPWNTKKIFVPETFAKQFVDDFVDLVKAQSDRYSSVGEGKRFSEVVQSYADCVSLVKAEGGKILCGTSSGSLSPTVVLDLPHCSTLQQDEVLAPLALISTVKYQYEAVRWANTGYLGLSGLILTNNPGDRDKDQDKAKDKAKDKTERLAEKLECGQVWANTWIGAPDGVVKGFKQSAFGDMNFDVFGSFYSNRKKIVKK